MKKAPVLPPSDGSKNARLFRNGENQAIQIPREFELPGTEVSIRQVGHTLVIEPLQMPYQKGSAAALIQALASLEPLTELADTFSDVDHGLKALEDVSL
jgi:antitoxin VapB